MPIYYKIDTQSFLSSKVYVPLSCNIKSPNCENSNTTKFLHSSFTFNFKNYWLFSFRILSKHVSVSVNWDQKFTSQKFFHWFLFSEQNFFGNLVKPHILCIFLTSHSMFTMLHSMFLQNTKDDSTVPLVCWKWDSETVEYFRLVHKINWINFNTFVDCVTVW